MPENRRLPDDVEDLHGAKILRLAGWDDVPVHVKVMIDHRETLARLDRVPPAALAKEALALLARLTTAVDKDLQAPRIPIIDEARASGIPGGPELDALAKVLHERDTDEPDSARQAARDAIAEYLAHRALLKAQDHHH